MCEYFNYSVCLIFAGSVATNVNSTDDIVWIDDINFLEEDARAKGVQQLKAMGIWSGVCNDASSPTD